MTEMEPGSQCIGTNDPAFVIAMVLGLASAVLLAAALVGYEAVLQAKSHVFLRRSLVWAIAQVLVFVGPVALTIALYALLHPDRTLCTSLVWRWYFAPPVVLVVVGVTWGLLKAILQARAPS